MNRNQVTDRFESSKRQRKEAQGKDKCTVCYRCVNECPKQAITLLGKKVIEQTCVETKL